VSTITLWQAERAERRPCSRPPKRSTKLPGGRCACISEKPPNPPAPPHCNHQRARVVETKVGAEPTRGGQKKSESVYNLRINCKGFVTAFCGPSSGRIASPCYQVVLDRFMRSTPSWSREASREAPRPPALLQGAAM